MVTSYKNILFCAGSAVINWDLSLFVVCLLFPFSFFRWGQNSVNFFSAFCHTMIDACCRIIASLDFTWSLLYCFNRLTCYIWLVTGFNYKFWHPSSPKRVLFVLVKYFGLPKAFCHGELLLNVSVHDIKFAKFLTHFLGQWIANWEVTLNFSFGGCVQVQRRSNFMLISQTTMQLLLVIMISMNMILCEGSGNSVSSCSICLKKEKI